MAERTAVTTSNSVTRIREKTGTIAVATTLTAADSGVVYTIPAATAGAEITLPTLKAGLNFKFIVAGAFATTDWTIVSSTSVIYGVANVNSVSILGAAENTISFVASAETIGDYVNLVCDGTSWYADGFAAAAGGVTFTDA
jgi:hypothetical protein